MSIDPKSTFQNIARPPASISETVKGIFDGLFAMAPVQTYTPEQQAARMGLKMDTDTSSPHFLEAEKIDQIQKMNSKGFRTVILNPNALSKDEFYCSLDSSTLIELLGPEFVRAGSGFVEDAAEYATPYWRTVELPIQGNFLKIEFLPARMNDVSTLFQEEYRIQDRTRPQNTNDTTGGFSPRHASDRMVLVNFNDNSSIPIIAKHGEAINTFFGTVFLTFKQMCPRIKVTIGLNSTITHVDDRVANANLSLGPGLGLFTNSAQNAVPFSFSHRDLNLFQAASNTEYLGVAMASGTGLNIDLISNLPQIRGRCYLIGGINTDLQLQQYRALYQYTNDTTAGTCAISGGTWDNDNFGRDGVGIFWIENIEVTFSPDANTATNPGGYQAIFEVVEYSATGASVVVRRKIYEALTVYRPITSGTNLNPSREYRHSFKPTDPIRVTLLARQALRVRLLNQVSGASADMHVLFTMQGYAMGNLVGLGSKSGVQVAPFDFNFKYTEHPYPTDLLYSNNPRY